jgi:hypothetical protein
MKDKPEEKLIFSGKGSGGGSLQFSGKDSNQLFEQELNENSENSELFLNSDPRNSDLFKDGENVNPSPLPLPPNPT